MNTNYSQTAAVKHTSIHNYGMYMYLVLHLITPPEFNVSQKLSESGVAHEEISS